MRFSVSEAVGTQNLVKHVFCAQAPENDPGETCRPVTGDRRFDPSLFEITQELPGIRHPARTAFKINGMPLSVTGQDMRQAGRRHKGLQEFPVPPSNSLPDKGGRAGRISLCAHAVIKTFYDGRIRIHQGPIQVKNEYLFSYHDILLPLTEQTYRNEEPR